MPLLPKRKNRGFLLLEVILSILIIASGITIVMRSYATSLRGADISEAMAKACFLLEDKLFELDAKGFYTGIRETELNDSGQISEEGNYSYMTSGEVLDDKMKVKINTVNLSVIYKKGNQNRKVSIVTYLKNKEG